MWYIRRNASEQVGYAGNGPTLVFTEIWSPAAAPTLDLNLAVVPLHEEYSPSLQLQSLCFFLQRRLIAGVSQGTFLRDDAHFWDKFLLITPIMNSWKVLYSFHWLSFTVCYCVGTYINSGAQARPKSGAHKFGSRLWIFWLAIEMTLPKEIMSSNKRNGSLTAVGNSPSYWLQTRLIQRNYVDTNSHVQVLFERQVLQNIR